MKLGSRAHQGG